jgi:hypothetical protein
MNKKANTLLFILGATLFNVLITIVSILLLSLLLEYLMPIMPDTLHIWGFPLIFIAAIAISFFAYRFVLKMVTKKIRIENYFDPIFTRRRK